MLLLVEHGRDGTARYILANGADATRLARPIPVLETMLPSIERERWAVGEFACLGCAASWVGFFPEPTDCGALECPRCGSRKSAIVEGSWCSACGHEDRTAREPGCPDEGLECAACHQMTAMVQPLHAA